jgi:hypothetical protein
MDTTFFASVFCLTVVLGLISLGFQIYVSRRLSRDGTRVGIPVGKRSWITPFVLGWQNAKQLEITYVMYFWSFILVLTFIGMGLTVVALLAVSPSS